MHQSLDPEKTFSTLEVCRHTGLSPRRVRYWAETGICVPSQRTQGGHARYSQRDLNDLLLCKIIVVDGEFSVQMLRRILPVVKKAIIAFSPVGHTHTVGGAEPKRQLGELRRLFPDRDS